MSLTFSSHTGLPVLSSFSRAYTEYAGMERIKKYSFCREGGGHKKSTLCMLLIMLTILDAPTFFFTVYDCAQHLF